MCHNVFNPRIVTWSAFYKVPKIHIYFPLEDSETLFVQQKQELGYIYSYL